MQLIIHVTFRISIVNVSYRVEKELNMQCH